MKKSELKKENDKLKKELDKLKIKWKKKHIRYIRLEESKKKVVDQFEKYREYESNLYKGEGIDYIAKYKYLDFKIKRSLF